MCCRLHGSEIGPLGEHGGVQSAKLLRNSHWILDFPSPGSSMASSPALNSPIAQFVPQRKEGYSEIRNVLVLKL